MKHLSTLFVAVAGSLAVSTAFAQSMQAPQQPMQQPAQSSYSAGEVDTGSGGVPQGSAQAGSISPETRQDVQRQLVQSERDGQLGYLNRTLYKGN